MQTLPRVSAAFCPVAVWEAEVSDPGEEEEEVTSKAWKRWCSLLLSAQRQGGTGLGLHLAGLWVLLCHIQTKAECGY